MLRSSVLLLCFFWFIAQLCPTLFDPIDSSPPGFPIPEILQSRTLEWVAISFSRGPSRLRNGGFPHLLLPPLFICYAAAAAAKSLQ